LLADPFGPAILDLFRDEPAVDVDDEDEFARFEMPSDVPPFIPAPGPRQPEDVRVDRRLVKDMDRLYGRSGDPEVKAWMAEIAGKMPAKKKRTYS
jgi:hypothetical protein